MSLSPSQPRPRPAFRVLRFVARIGRTGINFIEFLGGVGFLIRDTGASMPRGLIAKRGRRLGWRNLWAQMVRVGVRSIPIVRLVLFCIGAILSLQMAPILRNYGAVAQTANIISIATF